MIHQPLGGYRGQATDIEIHARETLAVRERLNSIMASHTKKTPDQIAEEYHIVNFLFISDILSLLLQFLHIRRMIAF